MLLRRSLIIDIRASISFPQSRSLAVTAVSSTMLVQSVQSATYYSICLTHRVQAPQFKTQQEKSFSCGRFHRCRRMLVTGPLVRMLVTWGLSHS